MKKALITAALMATSGLAHSAIFINEFLGSTTSTDDEFIELYNSGATTVDLSGWSIELWDSDTGANFGGSDGGSPHVISSGSISAGGFFLLANPEFGNNYAATPDAALLANAIENSSYTMILVDAGSSVIDSIFVTDGDAGDSANRNGAAFSPAATVGPDGSFLPAGAYRAAGDGSSVFEFLEFSPKPAPTATPGSANPITAIPEPSTGLLMALLGGAAFLFRRRK